MQALGTCVNTIGLACSWNLGVHLATEVIPLYTTTNLLYNSTAFDGGCVA